VGGSNEIEFTQLSEVKVLGQTANDVARWVKCESVQSGQSGPSAQEKYPAMSTSSTIYTTSITSTDECATNASIALINVVCFLLNRRLVYQSRNFETDGGFTERMYHRRTNKRIEL